MSGLPEGGAFAVRPEAPSEFYRVRLEVAYREGASPDAIRRAVNECHAEAVAECNRRFNQDTRRQRAAGERR